MNLYKMLSLVLMSLFWAPHASAQGKIEDAGPMVPAFKEGDVISYQDLEKLRPYLPEDFWANREFFFYEGMKLEIGPFFADYTPADAYMKATETYKGQPRLGPDGSLANYTTGQPFPTGEIDCKGDPKAGVKIMWDFHYRWRGAGIQGSFFYSYWDRGEQLPLYYEGTGGTVLLAHRPEPSLIKQYNGDLFRGEKRQHAFMADVIAPFDARGIKLLTYRYKSADAPLAEAENDDTWVYLPTLRRVRRISTAQRTDAISGTDFTLDDLNSFNGIVPQYEWTCLADRKIIAPMNTKVKGFPYEKEHNFGPYGLSFADDRWELRNALVVRMKPRNADHPYSFKDLYLDKETLSPLYAFAYDQKDELWKIIWHNRRWSQDKSLTGNFYEGWKEIEEPRALSVVSDIIANVQTGTGNRIEVWDAHGTPPSSKARIRRYIDLGRLTRGR